MCAFHCVKFNMYKKLTIVIVTFSQVLEVCIKIVCGHLFHNDLKLVTGN